jgi:hypothetical protein
MAPRKKTRSRPKKLGTRFAQNPINTTVGEMKKLGIPRWASKAMLLLTMVGAVSPRIASQANSIPLASTFTGIGARIRSRLLGMRRSR